MSITNDNILKSLAVLEQNLNDINSAKEQVNKVVKSSSDIAKVIESYQSSFEGLSKNVKAVLEDSRKFNLDSISKLTEQTSNFSKEITKMTEFDVSKSLKSIESKAVKQFEQNLLIPLNAFDEHINKMKEEVDKLTEFNFQDSFNKLEKDVINQFNTNLKKKLDIFDNKVQELQTKIEEFKLQILRLEKVDLEYHFKNILRLLTDHLDQHYIQQGKKNEEIKNQYQILMTRFDKQEKEIKTSKTLLFVSIAMVIVVLISIYLHK